MKVGNVNPDVGPLVSTGISGGAAAAGSGLQSVSDGSTTVAPTTGLLFDGATVADLGNGTAKITFGIAVTWNSGALSRPPTEAELALLLGPPTNAPGIRFLIDTGAGGYHYMAVSDGLGYFFVPLVRAAGATAFDIRSLTSAPDGGWSWFEDPRVIANGTYTYIGYNAGGDLKIAVAHAGAIVNTVTLHSALEYDDHDTPAMYVRSDGKLHAFYSKHIGPNIYERISTNTLASDPTLSGGFAAEASLSATFGASNSTYPSPVRLTNSDGAGDGVFLFWREHVAGIPYWWYSFNLTGTGWGGTVHLHSLTYSKVAPNGTGRVDVAVNDGPSQGASKLYHLYRSAAAWHKSDGTVIGGAMPFGASAMTLVWDGSGAGDLCWVADIAIDGSSRPIIVFPRYPGGSTSDVRYMYARWTGSAWSVHEICPAGGYIPDTIVPGAGSLEVYYMGGLSLDHADPQKVYASRQVSGQWEMFRYTTADGGVTFTEEQLTASSTSKQIRPVAVRDASDISFVWLSGIYHDYVNYSLGVKGLRP